jgi:hypothetical protein
LSVLAAATRSLGSSRGMIAPRVGEVIENPIDWMTTATRMR